MSSRHGVRPLRLMVAAAVIALLSTLFAATAAHAGTGSITGKVTKPSGSALGGTVVNLYWADADGYWFENSVKTRSDGTYTFGSLDRGKYVVGFGEESPTYAVEFWSNKALIQDAALISVGSTRVSSINARLAVGGKVTGQVFSESPNSHAVPDVEVAAYRLDGSEWTFGKSVPTSSDGSFAVGGLSDGEWTLEFNPPFEGPDADLALEYWKDDRTFDTDDAFFVQLGQTVTGKDAHLSPGGRISGRVIGPNGEPVVDALVFGYPSDRAAEVGNVAFTDENGNYVMTGLSAGQHRLEFVDSLEFDPFGEGPTYGSEWWDDESSFHGADRIDVVAGATTTGKNAQLDLASTPLVNTTPPSITGTPNVGATLTADPGAWTPHISDGTFEYQWFDGGTAITGADSKAFVPGANHLGRSISVEVTASRSGNTTSAMSAPTTPVDKGVLTPVQQPSITMAEPRVGQRLIGTWGTWSSSVEYTTQFLADGVPFAYDNTQGLPAEVLGKKLSIRQTSTSPAYETSKLTSAETAPVGTGQFDPPTTASISGVAIVGEPLETTLADAVTGANYQYQWLADGVAISGADQPTYTPTSAEVGKRLSVRLTMSKTGYDPAESTGASTDPVVEAGVLKVTPSWVEIVGTPRVGQRLSASTGAWQPDGVKLSYEWLADGDPIPGATDGGYTVTPNDDGKQIAVRVTGSRSGYASDSVTSEQTAPVVSSTPFGAPHDLAATGSTATTVGLSWTKVDGASGYRISYAIGTGTATKVEVGAVTSATLKSLKPNTAYSISIAALRPDGTRSSYSGKILARTAALTPPTGFQVTQQTPTTVTVAWNKVAGVPKYRLYYGIGTGTRTRIEVGDVSTKKITDLKPSTTYSVDIASLLNDGTRSSYTPRIDATTLPFLPPTDLASPGATSTTIDLTWTKAQDAAKYRISYGVDGGTRTRIEVGNVSNRTLTGLTPGTTYTIDMASLLPDGTRSAYTPRISVSTD